jgi:hypothetical protein
MQAEAEAISHPAGARSGAASECMSIRGRNPGERRLVRTEQTRPLVDGLKVWMERELHRVPPRSGLADAIRYAQTRWPALCRFLEDFAGLRSRPIR